jgi:D12 class N6 adenine-specific DNA methyltransferase
MLEDRFASKAPFPWYGGKSKAADLVWQLLGDVDHYCEPFAGSLAVLLGRPHECNRAYFSETVNDLDGLLVNAWRSIAYSPQETAEAASWPVAEADKSARQIRLLKWRAEHDEEILAGDPQWHDPVMGGWWLWAIAVQIGAFAGDGAWTADPKTGCIIKQPRAPREPGVSRDLPNLYNDGRGVNNQTFRETGVIRNKPHMVGNGQGVNNASLREPGVANQEHHHHPTTMPKLREWFALLSARLRHVRILNGQWTRLCTTGAMHTLAVRQGGHVGVFLDPPYTTDIRAKGLYAHDSGDVTAAVRKWCILSGDNKKHRIVVAGYDIEQAELVKHGWTEHEWFAHDTFLAGGMGDQQHRERLWSSPHCLTIAKSPQLSLFDDATLAAE